MEMGRKANGFHFSAANVGIAQHIHESHHPLDENRKERAQHVLVFIAMLNVVACSGAHSLAWRGSGIIALNDKKETQPQETRGECPDDPIQE